MVSCTTNGITVSVETRYLPEHSNPQGQKYIFGYHIHILNGSDKAVQLLRRQWYITDASGIVREVDGDGVVGVQPILKPGEAHEYMSFCNLMTEMGKMSGYYTMTYLHDQSFIDVQVPEFQMFAPFVLN